MNQAVHELEQLHCKARIDSTLKKNLLATRHASDPLEAFCRIAFEAGHPVTIGDLFAIGQEYSDNQCKSTNGGNPNPFLSFEDAYETFLESL